MYTLYGNKISGNSYKTKLTCALLEIDYQWVEVDFLSGEHKQPDFLKVNPLGQLPVLVIDTINDTEINILLESNAIICYLAKDSYLLPTDPIEYAQMLQWLFYEQAEIKANIASIRFIKRFQNMIPSRLNEYEQKFARSQEILSYLNKHLSDKPFLLGNKVSLADISLYVYTHLAKDGGIKLAECEQLTAWFKRIEGLEKFVAM